MIGLLAQLVFAAAVTFAVFCASGWAVLRLLELQLRMPVVALPAVAFTFGLGVWTVVLAPALALGVPILGTLAAYGAVTVALLVWKHRRERRRGHAKRGIDEVGIPRWTLVVIGIAALAGIGLRTRLAFDSLFHLGMIRRIAELESPTFENLDRVVGAGINPAYALPSWQAALAAISRLTGLDPATVLEAAAVVSVILAACCAGALGRVVTGTRAGEVAGAAAYVWMRLAFPRRELEGDGIAYAPIPGNIAIDILLPLVLVAAVLLLRAPRGTRRDGALVALAAVASTLVVVLHANYAVYVAIIGAGVALWLIAAGPWNRRIAERLGLAAASIAVPGLVALAALLPLLMLLDHFGAPTEARIDYHLASLGGYDLIRPGHLYDWFAAPGLLGILLLPWAVWTSRGAARALVGGGSLALIAFALVPPLLDLLGTSGSLTLGLRIPRPLGVLLVAAMAIAIPDLVARTTALADRVRDHRGRFAGWIALLGPILLTLLLVAAYGYPLARREPAEYGWSWPTIVAAVALVGLFVHGIARRERAGSIVDLRASDRTLLLPDRTMALALLLLAVALLPSGLTSMRRGAWQSREVVASYRADDLRCFDGVQSALRAIPAGDVLLADPVTAYGAQALAPVYVVGDFKTWNGSTDSERVEQRIQLLDKTFQTSQRQRAGFGLARLSKDFDAAWLLVARGEVQPPVGSPLYPWDARGIRTLLRSGIIDAQLVAEGPGRLPDDATDEERGECDLQLWKLDGSEQELELTRDEHGDLRIEESINDAANPAMQDSSR